MGIANIIRMPPDGTLPEGTKVAIWAHVGSETPVIRWTEGGPTVVIDTRKSPLKPLKRGLKMHREELLGR